MLLTRVLRGVLAVFTLTLADGLKVIGVSPGRTGTESLKMALEKMGFGPVYHMNEVLFEDRGISTAGHIKFWEDAANGKPVDWQTTLQDFNSGVGYPMSMFPEELMENFPDAKFVLVTRPAEAWWKSIQATICWFGRPDNWATQVLSGIPFFPFDRLAIQELMMDAVIARKMAPGSELKSWGALCHPENKAATFGAYNKWYAHVRAVIPSEKLLEFKLGEHGYDELAPFLGAHVPTVPHKAALDQGYAEGDIMELVKYPKVNAAKEFGEIVFALKVGRLESLTPVSTNRLLPLSHSRPSRCS
jgi:hypothetical protein